MIPTPNLATLKPKPFHQLDLSNPIVVRLNQEVYLGKDFSVEGPNIGNNFYGIFQGAYSSRDLVALEFETKRGLVIVNFDQVSVMRMRSPDEVQSWNKRYPNE
jgi:hypothetical protein